MALCRNIGTLLAILYTCVLDRALDLQLVLQPRELAVMLHIGL